MNDFGYISLYKDLSTEPYNINYELLPRDLREHFSLLYDISIEFKATQKEIEYYKFIETDILTKFAISITRK